MAVFTSTVRQLAHTTLNWDTQLNADMQALEGVLNGKTLVDQGALTGSINSATTPGVYEVGTGTPTGLPSGAATTGLLVVSASTGGSSTVGLVQLYTGSDGVAFTRTRYGAGSWSAWVIAATSTQLLSVPQKVVPSSIASGASITGNGDILLTNAVALTADGVFDSSKASFWRIEWESNGYTDSAPYPLFKFRDGGADTSGSDYAYSRSRSQYGASAPVEDSNNQVPNLALAAQVGTASGMTAGGTIKVKRFSGSARLHVEYEVTLLNGIGSNMAPQKVSGGGEYTPATPASSVLGFRLFTNAGTANWRAAVYQE